MFSEIFDSVRNKSPLIHCIANNVTINDVANIVLACGARPIMGSVYEDALEVIDICQGLNINLGNLAAKDVFLPLGEKANIQGKTFAFDPVGVGVSELRKRVSFELLRELDLTVIKGNISEIKTLATNISSSSGVDANKNELVNENNLEENVDFIKSFAKSLQTIIVITGPIDLVSDGEICYIIRNGRPEMEDITGMGCQLLGLTSAFISVGHSNILEATAAATCAMGLAGEIAFSRMEIGDGNATYRNRIIDAIYNMDGDILEEGAKYEIR